MTGIEKWNSFFVLISFLQKNVDEAVEKLKAKGIEVLGVVCHVSNAEQRKNLVDKTVQVMFWVQFWCSWVAKKVERSSELLEIVPFLKNMVNSVSL